MNKIISFKLEENYLSILINNFKNYEVENSNEHVLHMYKVGDLTITLYKSSSVVITGEKCLDVAKQYGYKEKEWLINDSHCGSDEVGTGDTFGPIVVVATYLEEKDIKELAKIGINDSKKLTDSFICDTVPSLINKYSHSILILDNETYNKHYSKEMNMNKIKAIMHNEALYNLKKKVPTNKIFVVDQFCIEQTYYKYLKNKKNIVTDVTFMTKAESYVPAVALSSMIARYVFLVKMNELKSKYKIDFPLGSGKLADETIKQIKENNPKLLSKVAKLNFKNTR